MANRHIDEHLAAAVEVLATGGPVSAYYALNNEHHIKYLGPAFFTKFLYFASVDSNQRALVLDARLAAAVRRLSGSNSVPGSAAWRTPKYALHMAYMDKVAAAVNRRRPRGQRVTTGQVELALFRQSA